MGQFSKWSDPANNTTPSLKFRLSSGNSAPWLFFGAKLGIKFCFNTCRLSMRFGAETWTKTRARCRLILSFHVASHPCWLGSLTVAFTSLCSETASTGFSSVLYQHLSHPSPSHKDKCSLSLSLSCFDKWIEERQRERERKRSIPGRRRLKTPPLLFLGGRFSHHQCDREEEEEEGKKIWLIPWRGRQPTRQCHHANCSCSHNKKKQQQLAWGLNILIGYVQSNLLKLKKKVSSIISTPLQNSSNCSFLLKGLWVPL